MKGAPIALVVATLLLSLNVPVLAQPAGSVELQNISHITTDRAGYFYAVTPESIHKYDSSGKELHVVQTPSPTTLFDTGNGVRLLAYRRDARAYVIYPPSLSPREPVSIDPSFAIEPWLVCSSGDYNLVILDAADWSVKRIDTRRSVVEFEYNLDSASATDPDFVFMREYQGFLFLADRGKGISIYNKLGMKLKHLPVQGLRSFNFLGRELYYYQDGQIHFTDLFTLETRSLKFAGPYLDVVIGNARCMALRTDGLTFLPYPLRKTSETDR